MINLAYLLFKCAKNNVSLVYGNNKFMQLEQTEMFGDDQEEMFFEAANYLRLALSIDENIAEANHLLGVFYE